MLKMSPFITFLLYCVFISFTTYYLTKDKLDETSRYILIGVLILPYIFIFIVFHLYFIKNINYNNRHLRRLYPFMNG